MGNTRENYVHSFKLERLTNQPMHLGGSPSQRPPSSARQTLSAPPSSLYPLTHEYVTLVGSERVTRLDTGCSGSPHAVESGTREGRERMWVVLVGSEINEEYVCTRCVGVMITFLILNGKRTLSYNGSGHYLFSHLCFAADAAAAAAVAASFSSSSTWLVRTFS